MQWSAVALVCALAVPAAFAGEAVPPDPLDSVQWPAMVHKFFRDQRVVFDDAVQVIVPPAAEDSMNVPVSARVHGLPDVQEIIAFIDFNPIPGVLSLRPLQALPYIGFRVRVQQSTPIRVAARTADGVWHVGGAWVDAAGGGCTLPSAVASRVRDEDIGKVAARRWPLADGGQRLKLRIAHPNDTGLISGTPAFFVEELHVRDAGGRELASLALHEPIAESPLLTLEFPVAGALAISGRDNSATLIEARVE
ncbi:quinoprotein dehydrogenase-associated SoxYZ-like carrier [Plasticicumulans acidivorans]|uniref:Sulfur-oxidizing protein SoxY n=1 Tax=Plasticicumulans acidivorans TaxID=886464 RepID=A0A317MTK6_9GAMM|nr:quinoprotein dehydrogenase-associated SoxYZ-like carrier [Plasticicumulans acidivorans]PWV60628.1 sulfur-oxidizing protein SoxY [Plasticicumulans acidivorans]